MKSTRSSLSALTPLTSSVTVWHRKNSLKQLSTWLKCSLLSPALIEDGRQLNRKWWKQLTRWCTVWRRFLNDSERSLSWFTPSCTRSRSRMTTQPNLIRRSTPIEPTVKSPMTIRFKPNRLNLDCNPKLLRLKTRKMNSKARKNPKFLGSSQLRMNRPKFWISSKSRSPIRFRKKMIHSWKNASATKTSSPMVIWVCTVPISLRSWRLVMPRNEPKGLSMRLKPTMIRPKPALMIYATISMPLLRVQRRKNEWTAFKIVAVTTVKSIRQKIFIKFRWKLAFRRRRSWIGAEKRPEHGSDRLLNTSNSLTTTTQTLLFNKLTHSNLHTSWGFGVLGLISDYD